MATITKSGAANSLLKYEGDYTMYIPLSHITYFIVRNSSHIEIGYGSLIVEFLFDDEAQRDAAMVTLLSWF